MIQFQAEIQIFWGVLGIKIDYLGTTENVTEISITIYFKTKSSLISAFKIIFTEVFAL